jgi:predicted negative regulator of RcsB-dependent stress response
MPEMAAYDLEEQEQLDTLKAWWKQWGNLITWAALVVALALAGWRGWEWWQQKRAAEASSIYSVLLKSVAERDMQRVKGATGELLEKFGGTAYAPMAAMLAGRLALETGDAKTARAQLSWAADNAKDEIRDLARLRLVALLIDEKAYDEALKQLGEPSNAGFVPRFSDLKGDIYSAQGKRTEAKAAYRTALDHDKKAGANDAKLAPEFREFVQQKLDNLGDA